MVQRRRAGDSSPPSSVASNVEGSHGTPAEIPPSSPRSPANPRAVNGSVKDGPAASEQGLHSPPLLHPRPHVFFSWPCLFFSARGRASSSSPALRLGMVRSEVGAAPVRMDEASG
jgi:hypothetical protein